MGSGSYLNYLLIFYLWKFLPLQKGNRFYHLIAASHLFEMNALMYHLRRLVYFSVFHNGLRSLFRISLFSSLSSYLPSFTLRFPWDLLRNCPMFKSKYNRGRVGCSKMPVRADLSSELSVFYVWPIINYFFRSWKCSWIECRRAFFLLSNFFIYIFKSYTNFFALCFWGEGHSECCVICTVYINCLASCLIDRLSFRVSTTRRV